MAREGGHFVAGVILSGSADLGRIGVVVAFGLLGFAGPAARTAAGAGFFGFFVGVFAGGLFRLGFAVRLFSGFFGVFCLGTAAARAFGLFGLGLFGGFDQKVAVFGDLAGYDVVFVAFKAAIFGESFRWFAVAFIAVCLGRVCFGLIGGRFLCGGVFGWCFFRRGFLGGLFLGLLFWLGSFFGPRATRLALGFCRFFLGSCFGLFGSLVVFGFGAIGLAVILGVTAGELCLFLEQLFAVFDRDLVIVGVNFREGEEAVAVAAVIHEGRLERRLYAGDFGQVDVAGELPLGDRFEIKFVDLVPFCNDDAGLFRVCRVDQHFLCHIVSLGRPGGRPEACLKAGLVVLMRWLQTQKYPDLRGLEPGVLVCLLAPCASQFSHKIRDMPEITVRPVWAASLAGRPLGPVVLMRPGHWAIRLFGA